MLATNADQIRNLRRRMAGTKSHLSRMENELDNLRRRTVVRIDEINAKTDQVNTYRRRYQNMVSVLRQLEGRA